MYTWVAQRKLLQGWVRINSSPIAPILLPFLPSLFTQQLQMSAVTLPIDISVTKTEGKARIEGSSKHRLLTSWQTKLSCMLPLQGNCTSANGFSALGISQRAIPRGSLTLPTSSKSNPSHLAWLIFICASRHLKTLQRTCLTVQPISNFSVTLCLWPGLQDWKNDTQAFCLYISVISVSDELRVFK